jgi:hypothetical protein
MIKCTRGERHDDDDDDEFMQRRLPVVQGTDGGGRSPYLLTNTGTMWALRTPVPSTPACAGNGAQLVARLLQCLPYLYDEQTCARVYIADFQPAYVELVLPTLPRTLRVHFLPYFTTRLSACAVDLRERGERLCDSLRDRVCNACRMAFEVDTHRRTTLAAAGESRRVYLNRCQRIPRLEHAEATPLNNRMARRRAHIEELLRLYHVRFQ